MRTLITLGTLLAVLLIPWTSLAPAWNSDAAGGSISSTRQERRSGPAVCLNPALGIVPLASDAQVEVGARTEPHFESAGDVAGTPQQRVGKQSDSITGDSSRSRVVCENGVCRLIDDSESKSVESNHEAAYARLTELGASQFRLDEADDEARFACSVPVSAGSRVQRRFEAKGATAVEALAQATSDIEAWLVARQ